MEAIALGWRPSGWRPTALSLEAIAGHTKLGPTELHVVVWAAHWPAQVCTTQVS